MSEANATQGDSLPLLRIDSLRTHFHTRDGTVRAVDGVSFDLERGETLCIVGESGCGKSVTALSILGLLPMPPGAIEGGQILLDGEDLVQASEQRMREIRGNQISMIFQEPMTSLNPVMRVGDQIAEALLLHQNMSKSEARERVHEMLNLVQIAEPDRRIDEYPHQLSGGMRQRVALCRALLLDPPMLLMDEPFGALDALTREQMQSDLLDMWQESQKTVLFITHSISEAVFLSDRVVVMSARPGKVREIIDVDIDRPRDLSVRDSAAFGSIVHRVRLLFQEMGVIH